MKKQLIFIIKMYQATLSPDHGLIKALFPQGVCRYRPTCSDYAIASIRSFGVIGLWLAIKRIARCHPFAIGGYDAPLQKQSSL